MSVIWWQVTKDLQTGVPYTVACVIDVFPTNMLRSKLRALELILTGFSKEGTVFAVQFIGNYSYENFVL